MRPDAVVGMPGQPVPGYPATPAGQASSFRDVLSVVRAVPGGRGLGAFYWDATWIAVPGSGWDPADPATGDAWENQAMFDLEGRALPVVPRARALIARRRRQGRARQGPDLPRAAPPLDPAGAGVI